MHTTESGSSFFTLPFPVNWKHERRRKKECKLFYDFKKYLSTYLDKNEMEVGKESIELDLKFNSPSHRHQIHMLNSAYSCHKFSPLV